MLYKIYLNGANPQKVAKLIGATIIVEYEDSMLVCGGDPSLFYQPTK
jgi:hypothetical protein